MSTSHRIVWEPIGPEDPLPRGMVLCTNNIEATRNDGTMSHVWVGKLKKKKLSKEYSDRYEIQAQPATDYYSLGAIRHIDFWAPLPQYLDSLDRLKLHGSEDTIWYSTVDDEKFLSKDQESQEKDDQEEAERIKKNLLRNLTLQKHTSLGSRKRSLIPNKNYQLDEEGFAIVKYD